MAMRLRAYIQRRFTHYFRHVSESVAAQTAVGYLCQRSPACSPGDARGAEQRQVRVGGEGRRSSAMKSGSRVRGQAVLRGSSALGLGGVTGQQVWRESVRWLASVSAEAVVGEM